MNICILDFNQKSAGKQEPVATPSPLGPAVPDSVVNLTDVMARLRKW